MIPATIEGYRELAVSVLSEKLEMPPEPIAHMIAIAIELIGRQMYEWEPGKEEQDG